MRRMCLALMDSVHHETYKDSVWKINPHLSICDWNIYPFPKWFDFCETNNVYVFETQPQISELHVLLLSTSSRPAKVINLLNSLKKPTQANKVPKESNRRLYNNTTGACLFYLNWLKSICLKKWGLRISFFKHILDNFFKKNPKWKYQTKREKQTNKPKQTPKSQEKKNQQHKTPQNHFTVSLI